MTDNWTDTSKVTDLSKAATGNDVSELTGGLSSVDGGAAGVPATSGGSVSHDHEGPNL